MLGKALRLLALLVALDIAAGAVIDAQLVARPWTACVALAQTPTGGRVQACGAALRSIWAVDLPAASWAVVREARVVWANSRKGVNTIG